MAKITAQEERDRDWDWYAVDQQGCIGHFTTAGIRRLPAKVKRDRDATLRLIEFFTALPQSSRADVIPDVKLQKGMEDVRSREWYLRSFVASSSRGLYAYDTDLLRTNYSLITTPQTPLLVSALPQEIQDLLGMRVTTPFAEIVTVEEAVTLGW